MRLSNAFKIETKHILQRTKKFQKKKRSFLLATTSIFKSNCLYQFPKGIPQRSKVLAAYDWKQIPQNARTRKLNRQNKFQQLNIKENVKMNIEIQHKICSHISVFANSLLPPHDPSQTIYRATRIRERKWDVVQNRLDYCISILSNRFCIIPPASSSNCRIICFTHSLSIFSPFSFRHHITLDSNK